MWRITDALLFLLTTLAVLFSLAVTIGGYALIALIGYVLWMLVTGQPTP